MGQTYPECGLSCAEELERVIHQEGSDCIARLGGLMLEELKKLEDLPIVGDVRGKGLLAGIEFVTDKEKRTPFDPAKGVTGMVVEKAFAKGVLIMPGAPGLIDGVAGDHIAISPPFTVDADQIRRIVEVSREVIMEVTDQVARR